MKRIPKQEYTAAHPGAASGRAVSGAGQAAPGGLTKAG
jgi:hypothetical protein